MIVDIHNNIGESIRVKGLMKFLAKAKLVELSDEEMAGLDGEAPTSAAEPEYSVRAVEAPVMPEPAPVVALPVADDGAPIAEGIGFETIYTDAGVPVSPYPAERLLKLLDGLRSMDAATRKMAVLAMDAADDSWTITDPVIDAGHKIRTLDSYKQALSDRIREAEAQTAAHIDATRRSQEENAAIIRQKIADLEQLMQEDISQSAKQVSDLEAGLRASRETAARETRRVDLEIERLREIPAQFGASSPTQAS